MWLNLLNGNKNRTDGKNSPNMSGEHIKDKSCPNGLAHEAKIRKTKALKIQRSEE